MRRALIAVLGLALFGAGLQGLAGIDGRLADAADRPEVRRMDVRQEIRAPGDCPRRDHREQAPARDELRL